MPELPKSELAATPETAAALVAVAALIDQLPVAPVPVVGTSVVVPAGSVAFETAVLVIVVAYAPANVVLAASVSVEAPLLTPVPPYVGVSSEPFHVPAVIVPSAVILVCTALGNVCTREGTPDASVAKIALFAVANPVNPFVDE